MEATRHEVSPEKGEEDLHQEVMHDHDLPGWQSDRASNDDHLKQLSPEEQVMQKKLLRKIDSLIMPLVILVYLLNYVDRNNYAAAREQGLEKDLNLHGNQYQVGTSILFVGYTLMQVPSNLLLNFSGRPSLYLGFWVVAWGLVSACTSQVSTYGEIVACRFILGFVEAPFFAGTLFYLSKWYTKSELSFRMAIFYSGSLLSGAFGSLIAAGILHGLAGQRGLAAWQWLYIIEGSITVFIGIIILFVLPDFPQTWKALSPELKHIANRRMALDAAQADVDEAGGMSQMQGMKQAFTDPKTYLLAIMYHGVTGATGFQFFFPTLTSQLGYGNVVSLLLVAPPYIFMLFWSFFHSFTSDRLQNRFWFWMYPIPITIAGCLIFMFTDSFGPQYFSLFLLNFAFAMNGTIYAWISSSIPRPPAKRAAALAFVNSIGNMASIWTPFTYADSTAPHYRPALGVVIGLMALSGVSGTALRFYLQRQNARLERLEQTDAELTQQDVQILQRTAEDEGTDFTAARQLQKGFRYIL